MQDFDTLEKGFKAFSEQYRASMNRLGDMPVSAKSYTALAEAFQSGKGFAAKVYNSLGDMGGKVRRFLTSAPVITVATSGVALWASNAEAATKGEIVNKLAHYGIISGEAQEQYHRMMKTHIAQSTADPTGFGGEAPMQMWFEGWSKSAGVPPFLINKLRPESASLDAKNAVEAVPEVSSFATETVTNATIHTGNTIAGGADAVYDYMTGATAERQKIFQALPVIPDEDPNETDFLAPTDIDRHPIFRNPPSHHMALLKTETVKTQKRLYPQMY